MKQRETWTQKLTHGTRAPAVAPQSLPAPKAPRDVLPIFSPSPPRWDLSAPDLCPRCSFCQSCHCPQLPPPPPPPTGSMHDQPRCFHVCVRSLFCKDPGACLRCQASPPSRCAMCCMWDDSFLCAPPGHVGPEDRDVCCLFSTVSPSA